MPVKMLFVLLFWGEKLAVFQANSFEDPFHAVERQGISELAYQDVAQDS